MANENPFCSTDDLDFGGGRRRVLKLVRERSAVDLFFIRTRITRINGVLFLLRYENRIRFI